MGLQAKRPNNRIVVTIDVCIDSIESLEDLFDVGHERFGKRDAYDSSVQYWST